MSNGSIRPAPDGPGADLPTAPPGSDPAPLPDAFPGLPPLFPAPAGPKGRGVDATGRIADFVMHLPEGSGSFARRWWPAPASIARSHGCDDATQNQTTGASRAPP